MIKSVGRAYLPALVSEQYLWHYFTTDKLYKLDTFLSGGLWLAPIESFEPIGEEGQLPEANRDLMKSLGPDSFARLMLEYEKAKSISYASCWTRSNDSNPDFFNHSFGGNGDAIAIRTTPRKLVHVAENGFDTPVTISGSISTSPLFFGSVTYIDHDIDFIPEAQTIAAAYAIKFDYENFENEARLLAYCYGVTPSTKWRNIQGLFGALVENTPGGRLTELQGAHLNGAAIVIKIDPNELIDNIFIGPNVTPSVRNEIENKISHYKFDQTKVV